MEALIRKIREYIQNHHHARQLRRALMTLAVMVIFVTTYMLVLPAITLDQDTAATDPAVMMEASAEEDIREATDQAVDSEIEETQSEDPIQEDSQKETSTQEEAEPGSTAEEQTSFDTKDTSATEAAPQEDAAQKTSENDEKPAETTSAESVLSDSVFSAGKADFETKDFTITITWDKDAGLTEDTALILQELISGERENPEPYDYVNKEYYDGYLEGTNFAIRKAIDEKTKITDVRFLNLTLMQGGNIVMPANKVKITLKYRKPIALPTDTVIKAVHFDAEEPEPAVLPVEIKKPEGAEDTANTVEEISFETRRPSFYAITYIQGDNLPEDAPTAETLTDDASNAETKAEETLTENYPAVSFSDTSSNVIVNVAAEEGTFPEGTTMEVTEADAAEVETAAGEVVEGTIRKVEAVDITFRNTEGEEIQPLKPIKVSLLPKRIEKTEDATVVHVDGDGKADVVESEAEGSRITFEAETFSVYAIVYTVDFHWEVDGKEYSFSLPGGGYISLEHLVELLGIARAEENAADSGENASPAVSEEVIDINSIEVSEQTKKFVADVVSVEFSNPELVWVGKTDEETTVGELKEANGLDVQYSAELTEEQISEINSGTVESGDWALISILPFTSEESLTVTMKNGDKFMVKVTDAQKPYKDVSTLESGTYIIYNSFDSSTKTTFLKNNGTSSYFSSTDGQALNAANLSDYTWTVTKLGNGKFVIRSTSSNRYINLYGNDGKYDQWSSSSYAEVNLSGTNGIVITYNNKTLKRQGSGDNIGKYYTANGSSGAGLTFFKIENGSSGGSLHDTGIELTDEERAELSKWEETIAKFNTLTDYDKTAEVFDYDNRIYKIDIMADSGIMDFYKDVDLGFVLDVSNSMKFPSSLKAIEDSNGDEQQVWMSTDWLNWASSAYSSYYNRQNCFYILSDPALTSTIYRVFWNGRKWQYQDASSNDPAKIYDINEGTVFKEPYRQAYTLYYADDQTPRIDYLNNSVAQAVATLKKIVQPTEGTDDETANVRIAYNFFAGTKTKTENGVTSITQYAIRGSHDFVDLRSQESRSFEVVPKGNEADGTRQDLALYDSNNDPNLGANEFGWNTAANVDRYVILVTDGAPNGASMSDVEAAARRLKTEDKVKLITIGLSTKDVDGGSTLLKTIADDVDGNGTKDFYEAEKASDLKYILLKILQSIMAKGLVRGKITDTIDKGFYPVDAQGNPLIAGVYKNGSRVQNAQISDYVSGGKPTSAHANEAFYTWEQVGDEWKITWYNQEIGWDDNDSSTGNPWEGTVYVKAKEDYLGGNLIETNDGHAQIEPTGIKLVINGTPETSWRPLEGMTPIELPVPRVNVHNLETQENSTTWTVYKGTSVTPGEQIKALWNSIPIEEVVSSTIDSAHKITTGSGANVGSDGTGETFTLGSLMSEVAPEFSIDNLINQITSAKSSASQEFTYTAYGHESGKITVKVERTSGNQIPTTHTADIVGTSVEQYKVTFSYKPYTEAERMNGKVKNPADTDHHNGANGRGAQETGTITSTNIHTINVFQKGIKITKVDKSNTNQALPGAVFELYRVDAAGQADVSAYNLPAGRYTKVGSDLTTDSNGVIIINPVFPNKDSSVTDKTLYLPNIAIGATNDTSHETVFYLVEKTAPTKDGVTYAKMPGAIKFIMTMEEDKGVDSTATFYDWTQTAAISAEDYGNGSESCLINDGEDGGVYTYRIKNDKPGTFKIIKQVTYNHQAPDSQLKKSKLAGTYTFTVYTDPACTTAYQAVPGTNLTVTLTIGSDGMAKTSDEISLPAGDYWIKENEPENDAYPITEVIPITVEGGKNGEHAAIATFTNNINEGEDQTFIRVQKRFIGLDSKQEIPENFCVTVTDGTNTYTLVKNPTEDNIAWSESEDGLIWTWQIFDVTPGSTYTVSETNEEISGYTVTTTGTGDSQSITAANISYSIGLIETKCSQKNWPVNDGALFAASMTNKTGGKGTLIVTKDRLSVSERKAIEETLLPKLREHDSNVWKMPVHYYSVQDNPSGFSINAGVITYNLDQKQIELSDTDIWQHVASVSFTKTDSASADFNINNTYQREKLDISLVKVDVNNLNAEEPPTLPGATFTIEKYSSLVPLNKDTSWETNGSKTVADTEGTGTFSFTGLTKGYYLIKEDVFPKGYVQDAANPIFEVRLNDDTGALELHLLQKNASNQYVDVPGDNNGAVKITNRTIIVGNTPGAALPNAGGPGTHLFYLLGILLAILACAGWVRRDVWL